MSTRRLTFAVAQDIESAFQQRSSGASVGAGWSLSDMRTMASDLDATTTLLQARTLGRMSEPRKPSAFAVLLSSQLFFAVLASVAMILCFFSLSASMATNIVEQRRWDSPRKVGLHETSAKPQFCNAHREIGIALALGLKASQLLRA